MCSSDLSALNRGTRAPQRWPRLAAAVGLGLSLLATGCVVAPMDGQPTGYSGYNSYSEPYYVNQAPPPVQYEQVGPPPAVGYVWVAGYWAWQMNRYVWTRGHWDAPRAGYHWVPHAWYRSDRGWYQRGGRWDRR